MPQEAPPPVGPWDRASVSSTTGELMMLTADRALFVNYLVASTDRPRALTLATQAIQRLAAQ